MLFLHVCFSNSNTSIAKQYLQFLVEHNKLPVHMRLDSGTLHAYLMSKVGNLGDPTDAIIYGQRIRLKGGGERVEMFFKIQLEK